MRVLCTTRARSCTVDVIAAHSDGVQNSPFPASHVALYGCTTPRTGCKRYTIGHTYQYRLYEVRIYLWMNIVRSVAVLVGAVPATQISLPISQETYLDTALICL